MVDELNDAPADRGAATRRPRRLLRLPFGHARG